MIEFQKYKICFLTIFIETLSANKWRKVRLVTLATDIVSSHAFQRSTHFILYHAQHSWIWKCYKNAAKILIK